MTSTMTAPNGRARPSLAQQIDKLEAILDGLADALNEAVAQATRQAVATAVKVALAEALANPDLRARIGPAADSRPKTSPIKRLLAAARRAAAKTAAAIGRLPAMTRRLAVASWRLAGAGFRRLWVGAKRLPSLTWRLRWPVLLALSVGGAVGWGCYVAGPMIASALGGLLGAANTLSARARRLQARPAAVTRGAKA
jgi:hypothetical protein